MSLNLIHCKYFPDSLPSVRVLRKPHELLHSKTVIIHIYTPLPAETLPSHPAAAGQGIVPLKQIRCWILLLLARMGFHKSPYPVLLRHFLNVLPVRIHSRLLGRLPVRETVTLSGYKARFKGQITLHDCTLYHIPVYIVDDCLYTINPVHLMSVVYL